MRVFYQVLNDGFPINENIFSAYHGFTQLGAELVPFRSVSLIEELTTEDIVVGSIPQVRLAFSRLGIKQPNLPDYPVELEGYLNRKIISARIQEVREETKWPVFIKPAETQKLFDGHVVKEFKDLLRSVNAPQDTVVHISECIEFVSEWRCFVIDGKLRDAKNYKGNFKVQPDWQVIEEMINSFTSAPVAYSLDVGLAMKKNRDIFSPIKHIGLGTTLCECNDFFSLGSYGLNPYDYCDGITKRWREITSENNQIKT